MMMMMIHPIQVPQVARHPVALPVVGVAAAVAVEVQVMMKKVPHQILIKNHQKRNLKLKDICLLLSLRYIIQV